MDPLRVDIRHDLGGGLCLIALTGPLTLSTAPDVRAALLKCFADFPDAVIVDATGLTITSRALLAVFPTAMNVHAPPTVSLAVCGLRLPPVATAGSFGRVLRHDSVAAGVAALTGSIATPRRHLSVRLPPTLDAPSRARRLVTTIGTAWQIEHLVGPAQLVISELVSNAVEHAGTHLIMTVAMPRDFLHLAVRDGSTSAARLTQLDPLDRDPLRANRGRGLRLVSKSTTAWGSTPTLDGKTVWATLRARHPGAAVLSGEQAADGLPAPLQPATVGGEARAQVVWDRRPS